MIVLFSFAALLCGSMMFSYWLGLLVNKNITAVGDGNPGAANLWKAAGYKYGTAGMVLDFLKGYLPVAFAMKSLDFTGFKLIPIALAPIIGHAFSPFLKWKGGKAIAVTFGVWSALTEFKASIVYAVILAALKAVFSLIEKRKLPSPEMDSFQTVFGMLLLLIYLYFAGFPFCILWIWLGNMLILLYKNNHHLKLFFKRKHDQSKSL